MTDDQKGLQDETISSCARNVTLHLSRVALCWLTLALVGPWMVLLVVMWPQWGKQCKEAWGIGEAKNKGLIRRCKPGPWGDLEFTRIAIEPPEAFVALSFDPDKKIQWVLPGYTPESARKLWNDVGLTPAQQEALAAVTRWDATSHQVIVAPEREFLLNLDSNTRGRLYPVLGQFPENHLQAHPYRFRANAMEEWFADSGLSDHTVQLIKKMFYFRGASVLFADEETLLPLIKTPAERLRAIKTLSRMSTLLVKLRVAPDSNLDELVNYWGRGRRSKDIRPLLSSLPKLPEGYLVDLVHLLPSFARKRLYTYPNPDADQNSGREDCHWTTLNFFNDTPDNRFLSVDEVRKFVETECYPVLGEPTFGDLVFLINKEGVAPHSCVYIADDIVFTKNGPEPYVPWILMELSDVQAIYYTDPPLEVKFFRHKNL